MTIWDHQDCLEAPSQRTAGGLARGESTGRGPEPRRRGDQRNGQAGLSLVELLVAMGVTTAIMALTFSSTAELIMATQRDSAQSYTTTRARGAMALVVRLLRNDFVQFNTRAATPLGVNFDLDDDGVPVVRDGVLLYFDSNFTAQIYESGGAGQPMSAGFDDQDGDGQADLFGIGMVAQDLNPQNGTQDFVDVTPRDGAADDLDRDGNADLLWTLNLVRFNNIGQVSDPARWRQGRVVATNVYVRRLNPAGALVGSNLRTFEYSAHNALAMLYDTAALGGNGNTIVDETEIGRMVSVDGVINSANEVSAIDSITMTLNVVEVTDEGNGKRVVLSGDISSDLITPRTLMLIKRNGIVGLADPSLAANVD